MKKIYIFRDADEKTVFFPPLLFIYVQDASISLTVEIWLHCRVLEIISNFIIFKTLTWKVWNQKNLILNEISSFDTNQVSLLTWTWVLYILPNSFSIFFFFWRTITSEIIAVTFPSWHRLNFLSEFLSLKLFFLLRPRATFKYLAPVSFSPPTFCPAVFRHAKFMTESKRIGPVFDATGLFDLARGLFGCW